MIIYNQSDEDLMDWVKAGQVSSGDELVRRYQNKFLAVAYRATRNHATAEDIAQDTIIAILEDCRSFDRKIARFSTWAYAILDARINKALKAINRDRMNISLSSVDEDRDDLLASAQISWFDDCSESRLQKLKAIVLKYLTPDEQILYYYREEKHLSYEEIALMEPFKSQGANAATLRKRRQYYIDKLIDALEMEKYTFKCLPKEVRDVKDKKNWKL
jgi:RNA polymerase sigma-70 factor (ECF subfamily)